MIVDSVAWNLQWDVRSWRVMIFQMSSSSKQVKTWNLRWLVLKVLAYIWWIVKLICLLRPNTFSKKLKNVMKRLSRKDWRKTESSFLTNMSWSSTSLKIYWNPISMNIGSQLTKSRNFLKNILISPFWIQKSRQLMTWSCRNPHLIKRKYPWIYWFTDCFCLKKKKFKFLKRDYYWRRRNDWAVFNLDYSKVWEQW